MGMLDDFIKLESYEGDQRIFIQPEDIVALAYDREKRRTKVTTMTKGVEHQTVVKETPGVICDMCDKVRDKQEKTFSDFWFGKK